MLGLQIPVSKVAQQFTACNAVVNIYQSRHPLVNKINLENHDIPVAHLAGSKLANLNTAVESIPLRVENNSLKLKDSLGEHLNAMPLESPVVITSSQFSHGSTALFITALFNESGTPLFWRHELDLIDPAQSIRILYSDGTEVGANEYLVVNEADPEDASHAAVKTVIAHSLDYSFDNPIYVTYTNSSGQRTTKILDNAPLFKKCPSTAIPVTYSLNSNANLFVYWQAQNANEFNFSIPDDYLKLAFREKPESYLGAYLPKSLLPDEVWFPSIGLSDWVLYDSTLLSFPEWKTQSFFPHQPYQYSVQDSALILNNHIIEVSNKNILESIAISPITGYIEILCYEAGNESPSLALTNNPALISTPTVGHKNLTWEEVSISVASRYGWIHVSENIGPYAIARVSYPFKSSELALRHYDLNPYRNSYLLGKTVVYYMVPSYTGQDRAVEALIYDEDGIIIKVTQDHTVSSNPDISSVVGKQFLPYTYTDEYNFLDSVGIMIPVEKTFYDEYVKDKGYRIVGEFRIPETLDEQSRRVFTGITELAGLNVEKAKTEHPAILSRIESNSPEKVVVDSFISKEYLQLHWATFNDYVASSYISKKDLEIRIKNIAPAGVKVLLGYDGVPEVFVNYEDSNWSGNSFRLQWHPVPSYNGTRVQGYIYSQIPGSTATLLGSISNLAITSYYDVTVTAGSDLLFYIIPFLSTNGTISKGPSSNTVRIRR